MNRIQTEFARVKADLIRSGFEDLDWDTAERFFATGVAFATTIFIEDAWSEEVGRTAKEVVRQVGGLVEAVAARDLR